MDWLTGLTEKVSPALLFLNYLCKQLITLK